MCMTLSNVAQKKPLHRNQDALEYAIVQGFSLLAHSLGDDHEASRDSREWFGGGRGR